MSVHFWRHDGNVIETITSQRFHNASGTGPLGTPTSGIGARVYYAANYYDNVDRLIASADAGTNGGTPWSRPGSVPGSSPTLLVSQYQYTYTSTGMVEDDLDPMGIDTRTYYDNLGRVTKTIQDAAGLAVTTEYGYDGNDNVVYVKADEPGGAYQKTQYVYAATTAAGDGVNSNDILTAIEYPDPSTGTPSTSQEETYLVNALGDVVQSTDRNGNVHQYSYDVLGRLTADAVTTLGAGVDGAVLRIAYGYDKQGNLSLITSYNSASGGNIVNQVEEVYNGLGQLTDDYQAVNGAVTIGSTPVVQYAYTEMANSANNSRLVSMTYPDGYTVDYNYNSGLDDRITRLSSIADNTGVLESYKYLGLDTVVERDHPQNNINLTYITQTGHNGSAGDQYSGLDQFGRVVDQDWYNTSKGTPYDEFQYTYNQDSEVTARNNAIVPSLNETYTYNNLGEITSFQRGSRTQSYTMDALGNFTSVTTNGSAQTRTANQQNEYTYLSTNTGIGYDNNGNLTGDGTGWTYKYDAWNRLVTALFNQSLVASYSYDGLNRRVVIKENNSTTDLYYSTQGQSVEEYINGSVSAIDVWSPVYVNALVYREPGGQGGPRYYALQDANWNITGWTDLSGNVDERYAYDPYGAISLIMAGNWVPESSSSLGLPYGFQGMRRDWYVGLIFSQDGRVENPRFMAWQQTDYIGQRADVNLYRVEGDQPTDMVDPSGLASLNERSLPNNLIGLTDYKGFWRRSWLHADGVYVGILDPKTGMVERHGKKVHIDKVREAADTFWGSPETSEEWNRWFDEQTSNIQIDQRVPAPNSTIVETWDQVSPGFKTDRQQGMGAAAGLAKTGVEFEGAAAGMASPSRCAADAAAGIMRGSGSATRNSRLAGEEALQRGEIALTKIKRPPRHHIFPQERRGWFKERGINIDDWTVELDEGTHGALHYGGGPGKGGGWWNETIIKELDNLEAKLGRKLTAQEIEQVGRDMMNRARIGSLPIVPYKGP